MNVMPSRPRGPPSGRSWELILETAAAGVVGATLGAYLNHRLPRAVPIIVIHSIGLTPALIDPDEVVEKEKQGLIRSMNEFPHSIGIGPRHGRMKMGEWLEYLNAYQAGLGDLDADVDEVESLINQARQLVAAEDFAAARPKFTSSHFWWHLLEDRYRRTQKEVFSAETLTRLDNIEPTSGLIDTDDDDDYLVRVEQGLTVLFHWSDLQPTARKKAAKLLARRCALAFALNDKPAMLELLDYVRQEIPYVKGNSDQLAKSIEAALREYQHVVVTGLLMNPGRLEYLVDSQACLGVHLKGYPRRRIGQSGIRGEEHVTEDVPINMIVETSSEEKEATDEFMQVFKTMTRTKSVRFHKVRQRNVIAVGPNNPTIVRFISERRLDGIDFAEELIRAYEGGERQAYLVLSIIKPHQQTPRPWYSKNVPFRDFQHQPTLPLKAS